jgi:hypothetical protein
MGNAMKKFLVFALLFAGTVEAVAPVDKSSDDKITVSGSYNPFMVSSKYASDSDLKEKYIQGTFKIDYDKRFHKNWEFHSSSAISKSKRTFYKPDVEPFKEDPEILYNPPIANISGYVDVGVSFWWDYLRIRADFKVYIIDGEDGAGAFPIGGLLLEAGKMDRLWVSTGFFHNEYPHGLFQLALNGKINERVELGAGVIVLAINSTFFHTDEMPFPSAFFRFKIQASEEIALKSYLNVKPYYYEDPEMMFQGSLGMEVSF